MFIDWQHWLQWHSVHFEADGRVALWSVCGCSLFMVWILSQWSVSLDLTRVLVLCGWWVLSSEVCTEQRHSRSLRCQDCGAAPAEGFRVFIPVQCSGWGSGSLCQVDSVHDNVWNVQFAGGRVLTIETFRCGYCHCELAVDPFVSADHYLYSEYVKLVLCS